MSDTQINPEHLKFFTLGYEKAVQDMKEIMKKRKKGMSWRFIEAYALWDKEEK